MYEKKKNQFLRVFFFELFEAVEGVVDLDEAEVRLGLDMARGGGDGLEVDGMF